MGYNFDIFILGGHFRSMERNLLKDDNICNNRNNKCVSQHKLLYYMQNGLTSSTVTRHTL